VDNYSTIAAISTPLGKGGIGIIKISGQQAIPIAASIFRKSKAQKNASDPQQMFFESHRLYYGHIVDPENGSVVDEVLLAVMKAPRSYTREDVVEINSHSGAVVLTRILELVLKMGARLAEPGEFTKRAFLNGRIDLTQAEGVIDIINAKTEKSLKVAGSQLKGDVGRAIGAVRDSLLGILAEMEATIDFPEEVNEKPPGDFCVKLLQKEVIEPLESLLAGYRAGRLYREGLRLAVVGRPNVGKSSLVNRMLQKDRIIVTDIPGTTRDLIEEAVDIHGIPAVIADTAGLHQTNDPVETIGIQKTKEYVRTCDLVLFMVDATKPITEQDDFVYRTVQEQRTILVINKWDLVSRNFYYPVPDRWHMPRIKTSALYNQGISELKDLIARDFIGNGSAGDHNGVVPNLRHKQNIEQSIHAVQSALNGLRNNQSEELIVIDLKEAVRALDEILGLSASEEIIDQIFSRFCIGK